MNSMSLQNANDSLDREISASAKIVFFFLLGSTGLGKEMNVK